MEQSVRCLFRAGVAVLLTTALWAQQNGGERSSDEPRFRVEAFSALHEVRVLDGSGSVVRGLAAEDFRVLENGAPRPVIFFLERSNYPVTLVCLVDTGSNMSEEDVGVARDLIFDLMHRLEPEDRILLAAYADEVHYLTPLTSNRLELLEGLRNLSATGRKSGLARLARLFASDAWTGPAVDEVLLRLKREKADEKVLLVFSAGFGNIGVATRDHLRSAGARLIAVAVDNRLGDLFNLAGDQTARRKVVRGSGGVSFSADEILQEVAQVRDFIKHHYLLAFEPQDPEKVASAKIEFSIPGHPDYSLHVAPRSRSNSSFY